jgi:3-oxoacyl-[acyl-carrier protein] reductase
MEASPAVLVLGGTGGIGSAIVERFRSTGQTVIATGRSDFDLRDRRSIEAWLSQSRPKINVLVHSAGLNHPRAFRDLDDVEIRECFEVNVEGFLTVARGVIPDLAATHGRIVVLSSIFGFLSRYGRLPYAMSKHALVGVVKSLALELAPDGILVNAVSPGYIDTPLTRANNDPETVERLRLAVPLRRLGSAMDIAEVVYFLGSEANQYVTGQDVVVDGGFSIDGGRG